MPSSSPSARECANSVDIAAKVFMEHGDFIRTIICRKIKDEAQADDLFQDFFLSLVSKPPSPDIRSIKSYLYRTLINDVVDASRRVEKYKARLHRYKKCAGYPEIGEDSPEKVFIETEETNKMFKLIEKWLPYSEAKAVTLRYRDNRSVKEVASGLGVTRRTATRYISAGLRKIRQFLTIKP